MKDRVQQANKQVLQKVKLLQTEKEEKPKCWLSNKKRFYKLLLMLLSLEQFSLEDILEVLQLLKQEKTETKCK